MGSSGIPQQGQNGGPPWQNQQQGVNPLALLFPRLAQMQQQQDNQNYARSIDQYNLRRQHASDESEAMGNRMLGQTEAGLDQDDTPAQPKSSMQGQPLPLPPTMAGVAGGGGMGTAALPTGEPQKPEPSHDLDLRSAVRLIKKQVPDIGKHPEQMHHILTGLLPFMKQEDKERTAALLEQGRQERDDRRQTEKREHDETMAAIAGGNAGERSRHNMKTEDQGDRRGDQKDRALDMGQQRIEIAKNRMAQQHEEFGQRLKSNLDTLNAKMAAAKSVQEKRDIQGQMRMAAQQAIAASNNAARIAASMYGGGTGAAQVQAEATKQQTLYGDMTKKYLTGGGGSTSQAQPQAQSKQWPEPTPAAIDVLKLDPAGNTEEFDAQFGPGAAKRYGGP